MRFNILLIFWFTTVNITRYIEIEFVFLNISKGNHFTVAIDFSLLVKYIDNFVDIHFPQAIFITVFNESFTCINYKDAFTSLSVFFINEDNAGWYARAVKQIGW